jgi:hypothetical protein
MKMLRQVAHMGERGETLENYWPEDLKGRDHLEDLVEDGIIILDWILEY